MKPGAEIVALVASSAAESAGVMAGHLWLAAVGCFGVSFFTWLLADRVMR